MIAVFALDFFSRPAKFTLELLIVGILVPNIITVFNNYMTLSYIFHS